MAADCLPDVVEHSAQKPTSEIQECRDWRSVVIRLLWENLKVRYLTWKYREMLLAEQMKLIAPNLK